MNDGTGGDGGLGNGHAQRFSTGEREALLYRIQLLELEAMRDKRVPFWLPWLLGGLGTTLATLAGTLPAGSPWQQVVAALSAGVASFVSAVALSTRGTK